MDIGGVELWVYLIVGGVQLVIYFWMLDLCMSSDELIDYLMMLSWSVLCGIVEVGGLLEKFCEQLYFLLIVFVWGQVQVLGMFDVGVGFWFRLWVYVFCIINLLVDGLIDMVIWWFVVIWVVVLLMILVFGLVVGLLVIGEFGLDWCWFVLWWELYVLYIVNNFMNDFYDIDVGIDSVIYVCVCYVQYLVVIGVNCVVYIMF